MARAQWTDDFLERQRHVGDPVADEAIAKVFSRQHSTALSAFLADIVTNDAIPPELPDEIHSFLANTSALPSWANQHRLDSAATLFNGCGPLSIAALVCASLPECYTMRTGVRILDLTSQLGDHTNRRLHQTAAMVLKVLADGAFKPQGLGIRQTQKVRLIHAAIRHGILRLVNAPKAPAEPRANQAAVTVLDVPHFDWQVERDGVPLNQEDMAFTLLTFGHVIPLGMRAFGLKLSKEEYEVFLHCWNVSGYILGVNEDLMAHNEDDATELFARIKARQAGPSAAGTRLTHSLLTVVEEEILKRPIFRPLAPIALRMLVGDATAAMLGLDLRHPGVVGVIHRVVARTLRTLQEWVQAVERRFPPFTMITVDVGTRIINHFFVVTNHGLLTKEQPQVPPLIERIERTPD